MIRMPRPGPGNGCRQTMSAGRPSCSPTSADLVLEQRAQRLDELELQVVGQPADVVVRLDVGGAGAAAGLDDVGVERALHEELDLLALRRRVADDLALGGLEDPDELAADDLALLLGVGDARRARRGTASAASTTCSGDAGRGDEVALDLLGLALAQQAVVDEHAGELVADRPLHERRGDRGVDAAGEPADRPPVADLRADLLDLLLDDVHHRPGRPAAGDLVAGSARAPAGRARCAAPRGATARRRAGGRGPRTPRPGCRGRGEHVEAVGRRDDRVAVAHPHPVLRGACRRAGCRTR